MRRILLITCMAIGLARLAYSQPVEDDLPQITGCIALLNAKVVSAPGKSPVVSTIVMRDGLITAFGENVQIPADAYRISADSFYVYPAFIDAFSDIGMKEPEEGGGNNQGPGNRGQRPAFDAEGNPSLEDAGITPYKSVRATFDPKEKSISEWRAQGFAIAHVVPKGKMLPGQGTIIVLSGKETDQVLWKEDISMFGQWTGAGGSYPSTVIGVMAKWRELYQNASQYVTHRTSYENAPLISRPKYNQAHQALLPVVTKEMPLYFRAPKVKDISRAISLQKDLGMKMVIADAEETWYLKDQLKSGQWPIILSLDLPEDKAEDKDEDKDEDKEKDKETDSDSTVSKTDTLLIDQEKLAFEKRRAESLKAHYEQASVLEKEGITFSLGTMSGKPSDFSKNIRIMMENGLTFNSTLHALTTQPAKLLGVEKYCGSIEPGKMANVIVSTKPLFEKEAFIKFMIVEGNLFAYEIKEKKKPSEKLSDKLSDKIADQSADKPSDPKVASPLAGVWTFTVEFPDENEEGEFDFTDDSGDLSGTITSDNITTGNNELESIVMEGNTVSFTFDMETDGQIIVLEFDLNLDGDSFDGTVKLNVTGMGSFPITGKRVSKPN